MKGFAPASQALVVGTVGFDTIETLEGCFTGLLGGSAWFGALAAARFAPVEMVAAVGYDFTEAHRRILTERGIGLEGLFTSTEKPTFFWHARYGQNFATRETVDYALNALEDFYPQVPEAARNAACAMLCNFKPALQRAALEQLSPETFVLLDTIDIWINEAREELLALLPRCGMLLLNDEEAHLLTGERDGERAAGALMGGGASAVIIKRGSAGSLLVHPQGTVEVPVCRAEVVRDPTGAGDTYGGAILGRLTQTQSRSFAAIRDAMHWGAALASFTVEALSSERLLAVTPEEVRSRREKMRL